MRLVLWDIDGTLVHTAGHGRVAFAEAFERVFGAPPAMEGVKMAGRTDPDIALEILESNGVDAPAERLPDLLDALVAALAGRAELIATQGRPLPGVRAALEWIGRDEGVVQGLLTGNVRPNALVKLAAFGLDELLDLDVGGYGSDGAERAALVAVARDRAREATGHEIPAERTTLVGDTPRDVHAAHAVGAQALGLATGPYSEEDLRAAGADAVLPDAADLPALSIALGLGR